MTTADDSIDTAYEKLCTFINDTKDFSETIETESDTRLKVIDTILLDVLGWNKRQVSTEEKANSGFLDYKLSVDEFAKVIVEAKRDARSFDLADRKTGDSYKLCGAVFKNANVKEGINQAIQYSAYKGSELGCVTNGREWVVFRSNRIGDGTDTLDGKAFVFTSLEGVKEQFRLFYDLLAESRVRQFVFRGLFQDAEGRIIRNVSFEKRLRNPSTANLLEQPSVVPSLDKIMTSFFQRLSDENDNEMIEQCFVETKESRAAEQRLMRLAEDLAGHIRPLNTGSGAQLAEILQTAKDARLHQFILLVGTKGAGKTTFVRRFFNLKLPRELSSVCNPISVNLGDSDGDEKTVIEWLRTTLLEKAENALGGSVAEWDEIVGHMFFSEYQRWSTGSMKHLYEKDKQEFKIQFGKHIENIRATKPLEYIRGLLRNMVGGRKQVPCLVFDNADHFSIDFQERVFQFARSLFEQEFCVVIMPITDKTSWQLSRQGALQSFENEALLLPTPSAKQVVEKRIEFVFKKLKETKPKERDTYFFGKGIRVDFSDLLKFGAALEQVFLNSDKTAYWLGGLSNHDIRQVLALSRDVISSPHLGFDDAFQAYLTSSTMHIPQGKIRRALIKGRYDIYPADAHKYVHNVFDLNTEATTSPLLGLRLLQVVKDAEIHDGESKTQFIEKAELVEYMSAMGFERHVVLMWLDALLKRALVFNYDPTCVDANTATKLEISPSGELHLFWGSGCYDYLYAMGEVTLIRDEGVFEEMQVANHRNARLRFEEVTKKFAGYLAKEDRIFCRIPEHPRFSGQNVLLKRIENNATRVNIPTGTWKHRGNFKRRSNDRRS